MLIVRDIPLTKLRQAVFDVIKNNQTHKVYGVVPNEASLPYILIGALTFKPDISKTSLTWLASQTVHCYADTKDLPTCNEMMEDVATIITGMYESLVIDGYKVIDCELDLAESFEEEDHAYHGVLTFLFSLAKIKKE